jgi:hypothetical protein
MLSILEDIERRVNAIRVLIDDDAEQWSFCNSHAFSRSRSGIVALKDRRRVGDGAIVDNRRSVNGGYTAKRSRHFGSWSSPNRTMRSIAWPLRSRWYTPASRTYAVRVARRRVPLRSTRGPIRGRKPRGNAPPGQFPSRGDGGTRSTGSAALHPWLQPAAPSGAENQEAEFQEAMPLRGSSPLVEVEEHVPRVPLRSTRGYNPRPHPGPKTFGRSGLCVPLLQRIASETSALNARFLAPEGPRSVATGGANEVSATRGIERPPTLPRRGRGTITPYARFLAPKGPR